MGPDWYDQHGWHHVGMGGTLELLAMYGAILLIVALAAGGLWLARRRHAQPAQTETEHALADVVAVAIADRPLPLDGRQSLLRRGKILPADMHADLDEIARGLRGG